MKKIQNILTVMLTYVVVVLILSGCLAHKDFVTESDYSYHGKFSKYKSFNFMNNTDNDKLTYKDVLEKAITVRMGSQGYSMKENKPDLLIMYKVFFNDLSIRGYNQPNMEKWYLKKKHMRAF